VQQIKNSYRSTTKIVQAERSDQEKSHFPGNPEAPPIFAVRQSYHKAAKPKIPLTKNLTLYLLYLYDNQLINLIVCSRKSKPFPKVFMIDNR